MAVEVEVHIVPEFKALIWDDIQHISIPLSMVHKYTILSAQKIAPNLAGECQMCTHLQD